MSDILERLRGYTPPDRTLDDLRQLAVDIHEAADAIEHLRARIAALTEAVAVKDAALKEISGHRGHVIRSLNWSGEPYEEGCIMMAGRCADIAEAALAHKRTGLEHA